MSYSRLHLVSTFFELFIGYPIKTVTPLSGPCATFVLLLSTTRGVLPYSLNPPWVQVVALQPEIKEFQETLATIIDILKDGKTRVTIKAVWDLTMKGLREAHQSWGKVQGIGSLLIRVRAQQV